MKKRIKKKATSLHTILKNPTIDPQNLFIKEGLHPKKLVVNTKMFAKTKMEKQLLKQLKKEHKNKLVKAGLNPKKTMNSKISF